MTGEGNGGHAKMMSHARPIPSRGKLFRFGDAVMDGPVARFQFSCDRHGSFDETVDFEVMGTLPDSLLTLLHVALGVSTYKAAAAEEIVFPPLTPAGRRMAEALYTYGLAEFFVRSGLPYPSGTVFHGEIIEAGESSLSWDGPPLVAFGGGKDSYVAGAIVERALGEAPQFASVVLSDAVAATLSATAPSELLFVNRTLDPKLLDLKGAFSGHVPITAINLLVLTIASHLRGMGPVIFANERSADEPTITVGGQAANHQYSKSSEFEELLRNAVAEAAPGSPASFSVLRPYSELWIGRSFSSVKAAFPRFTSCNRNFRLAGDADQRWCGRCAKCAFTSLILAPFISAEEGQAIFGRIMLNLDDLQGEYRELVGLADHKPWDCVGTIDECQAALYLASKSAAWAETAAVKTLMPELLRQKTDGQLERQVAEAFAPEARGAVPTAFHQAAELFG
ncbi:MAG: hypothetical protein AAGI89_06280 [Pseudomonadota bacterium]